VVSDFMTLPLGHADADAAPLRPAGARKMIRQK
jgi:hypothetical protein